MTDATSTADDLLRGDRVPSVYGVYRNSDQTEGRGRPVLVALFDSLDEAVAVASDASSYGVQGVGGGEVVELPLWATAAGFFAVRDERDIARLSSSGRRVWGSRQHNGRWSHGYIDLRDVPSMDDPEYREYLRLKDKFA